MTEITDLEQRITAALNRIRRGVEALESRAIDARQDAGQPASAGPGADAGRLADLEAELDDERTANAQLEERVKALKLRQDGRLAELEAQVLAQNGRFASLDGELQRLRQTNADLREANARLRDAVAEDLVSPELVNAALKAELDALRAVRATDRAEIDAIIGELQPLIAETE